MPLSVHRDSTARAAASNAPAAVGEARAGDPAGWGTRLEEGSQFCAPGSVVHGHSSTLALPGRSLHAVVNKKVVTALAYLGLEQLMADSQLQLFGKHSLVYSNVPGFEQPIFAFGEQVSTLDPRPQPRSTPRHPTSPHFPAACVLLYSATHCIAARHRAVTHRTSKALANSVGKDCSTGYSTRTQPGTQPGTQACRRMTQVTGMSAYYANMVTQMIFTTYCDQLTVSLITDASVLKQPASLLALFVRSVDSWHKELHP